MRVREPLCGWGSHHGSQSLIGKGNTIIKKRNSEGRNPHNYKRYKPKHKRQVVKRKEVLCKKRQSCRKTADKKWTLKPRVKRKGL